jgi:hypothetical protein
MNEMENIYEIGRTMQCMVEDGDIEIIDEKGAFMYALELAMEFEEKSPDTENYYFELDDFATEKLMAKFNAQN